MRLEVEQMLPLDGHTRITTQLSGTADGSARVEIHSRSGNGWSRHAVAKIEPAQPDSSAATRAPSATGGIEVSPADFYAALRQTGQHHGPAFAALTRIVRHTAGGSDTEITVPAEASRHPGFRVHPVMLDAALQSMAAAMPDRTVAQAAEISYLPVSFETIRVLREVGRHARCHAEVVDLDEAGAGKLGTVTLTDDAGNVMAELTGVYVRRVERRALPLPLEQKIFDTAWVESPLGGELAAATGSWLVLADAQTSVAAKEFAALWSSAQRRVITADLTDEADVRAAFAETGADAERPPAGVVLFIGGAPDDLAEAVTRARDSIWSIASTVRTIVGGWHGRSPRLWLVTRRALAVNGDGPGDPAAASLRGLIRVLAYEHSDLRATLVDLDDDPGDTLAAELGSAHSDDIIAYRSGHRYAERLARAELCVSKRRPVVRAGAAYVVTGGLGGLGTVVARWLVDNGAGRVVLNGRNKPSDDQRKILAEFEAVAEIAVVEGDIASPGMAEQLVAAAEETGRELRGIVHGAAVIDDGLLIAMTRESLERVWAPKAIGAVRLHEASAGRQLDWWTGFSSVASLLGSPGQGAYAVASAWLDGLMTWRAASGLPATGINWGPWSEVGVARSLTGTVLDPITPTEGIEALDTLLGTDRTLTGVARLRADRALAAFPEIRGLGYFSSVVEELDAADDGGDWAGVDSLRGLDPAEAQRIITDRLCARIAAVMGYADPAAVETTLPLTEMGLDSLMAVRIRNTAGADFGVEPPVALLLQGATLADVAADLGRQLGLAEPNEGRQTDQVRDRAQQRAAARQEAALRRKRGQRV
jgi:phthiocerol/phenolphthiocerol synthesis type-I polyketide synthase D